MILRRTSPRLGLATCATKKASTQGFPGGPVPKAPRSQSRGLGFNPWSGNWIPHVATKDPACHNTDQRSRLPQLRPWAAK